MTGPWEDYQSTSGNPWDDYKAEPQSQTISDAQAPQPDLTRQVYQGLMNNVAKPINDTISSGIGLIGSAAKEIIAPVPTGFASPAAKQIYSGVGNAIGQSPIGVAVGEGAQQVKDEVNDLAQYDQNLKADLSALGQNTQLAANLPMLKPLASGAATLAEKFESAAAKAPGILGDATSGISVNAALGGAPDKIANITKAGVTTTPQLADVASHFYNTAEQTGGLLKPEAMQRAAAGIRSKVLNSTPEGQIFGGNTVVDDFLTRLDKVSSMQISLKGLDQMDGALQDAIATASRAGDKATVRALKTMKEGLRNASATAKPSDIVNPEAFQAWRNGDIVYAAKMKSQQIDDIVKNAYNKQVPSSGIKTGFGQLAKSIDKYGKQGWTDGEIAAIRKAAKSGIVGGSLSTIGGKLMSGIAGTAAGFAGGGIFGAPIGLVAGEAAGFPMRAAANTLQRARATQVQRLVGERPAIVGLMDKAKAQAQAEFIARKAKLKP